MATSAQINANIANAQRSTGARTQEGHAASSKNATKTGLFTVGDFVRPCEREEYAELRANLQRELAPIGTLEQTLADEIRRATWRLRRCSALESEMALGWEGLAEECQNRLMDPMVSSDPESRATQRSVDRARAQALRNLKHATAELRKLQTERHSRAELRGEFHLNADLGVADAKAIAKVATLRAKLKTPEPKVAAAAATASPATEPAAAPELQRAA